MADGNLPSSAAPADVVQTGRDLVNNQPPILNDHEASIGSSSRGGSHTSYPFDSQTSLENQDGGKGTYRGTIQAMPTT